MRRPHAGELPGFGFDRGAEVVAAVGTLLLQVEARKKGVRDENRGQSRLFQRSGRVRLIGSESRL